MYIYNIIIIQERSMTQNSYKNVEFLMSTVIARKDIIDMVINPLIMHACSYTVTK